MYNNKLAIAVKHGGKILREFGEKVYIPFGSEYTLLIKNLNTTKAIINITIDGTNATELGLIVNPGSEIEFERFLKKDLNKGNRFKFIERTTSIEKHRGIGIEDGLINVSFQFEKQPEPVLYVKNMIISDGFNTRTNIDWIDVEQKRIISNHPSISTNCTNFNDSPRIKSLNFNETGITVPGSISEQKFVAATIGMLEYVKHNMVIKLVGQTEDNQPVSIPVTVDIKPKCVTCGRNNKATMKFCGSCGTSLQIAC